MNIGTLIAQRTSPFYSFEFFPPKDSARHGEFFAEAAKLQALSPLFVSVTYGAGGSNQQSTLDVVMRLKEMGFEPMSHLTCVGADEVKITDYLTKLHSAGVDNILALRGDAPAGTAVDWKNAAFRHASDLVRFVRDRFPGFGIGVAGYPAPHPESKTLASDHFYTSLKIREGADFVVTQLFFDVREYFAFTARLRFEGINVPVIPGVMPIQSFESLRRILSLSGTNIPGKLYIAMEDAHKRGGAEAVREEGFKFAVNQIKMLLDGGAPGIHLYSLNQSAMCERVIAEVGAL